MHAYTHADDASNNPSDRKKPCTPPARRCGSRPPSSQRNPARAPLTDWLEAPANCLPTRPCPPITNQRRQRKRKSVGCQSVPDRSAHHHVGFHGDTSGVSEELIRRRRGYPVVNSSVG
ncbi:hypothetical protein BKA81DRAFT_383074 [Phyllosticta paracitricarpa]